MTKKKLGILGCGYLGGIVAEAYRAGLLPDYELVGVTSRSEGPPGRWPNRRAVHSARI